VAARSQGQESTVSLDDPLLIGAAIVTLYAGGWALWHFGHTQLAKVYAYTRYLEFFLLRVLGEMMSLPGIRTVHQWLTTLCAPDGLGGSCKRDFSTVTWSEIANSSFYVNLLVLLVLMAYCTLLFRRAHRQHPKLRYARRHSIRTFVDELKEARNPKDGELLYPHLRLFGALDLVSAPLDDPLFGMSETSKQFLFKHGLVLDWRAEPENLWAPTLDRAKATAVFRAQLGSHWTSSANLSPGETLAAAVTMSRVAATDTSLDPVAFKRAMQTSETMIRFCWDQFQPPPVQGGRNRKANADPYAWLHPPIDLDKPREIIKRYIGHPAVQRVLERHAFARTVLFALFIQARRLGVLQPAELRWLRFYDRGLWYAIETFGREAGFAEAAGVLSHYLYEARAGVSIPEPQLDKAVSGLETALSRYKFTTDDRDRYYKQHPTQNQQLPSAASQAAPQQRSANVASAARVPA
jgi:intracellular multiplication protein IcmP